MGQFFKQLLIIAVFIVSARAEAANRLNSCQAIFGPHPMLLLEARHFSASQFGLTHADRPGHAHFARWSATLASQILVAIREGRSPHQLFTMAAQARQQFASSFEGASDPLKAGYGVPRQAITEKIVGKDFIGVSSLDLALNATKPSKEGQSYPDPFWAQIAHLDSRTRNADSAIRALRDAIGELTSGDQDALIVDRFYEASDRAVFRAGSTEVVRVRPGESDSPYMVSSWNAPRDEIAPIMHDVEVRIGKALSPSIGRKKAFRELAIAMHGFFVAMPYYRGTAAIGRAVFTALFSHIAQEPISVHPEADIKALIMTNIQYLRELEEGRLVSHD